jgi:hypothetical protein
MHYDILAEYGFFGQKQKGGLPQRIPDPHGGDAFLDLNDFTRNGQAHWLFLF